MSEEIYLFKVKDSHGNSIPLSDYAEKVILVVNVASKCGFTPQYKGLELLYRKYSSIGLVILGFPCNQFGAQEPGTEKEIQEFCSLNYDVTFPILAKIKVNGDEAEPFFKFIKEKAPGIAGTSQIKWNFTKFLISKDGKTIKRFAPNDTPESLEGEIQNLLKN